MSATNDAPVPARPETNDAGVKPLNPVTTEPKSAAKPPSSHQSESSNCPNSKAPASSVTAGVYRSLRITFGALVVAVADPVNKPPC